MALTEAQKKYQNSEKGKAARAAYMARRKEKQLAQKATQTEQPEQVEAPVEQPSTESVSE